MLAVEISNGITLRSENGERELKLPMYIMEEAAAQGATMKVVTSPRTESVAYAQIIEAANKASHYAESAEQDYSNDPIPIPDENVMELKINGKKEEINLP